MDSKLRHMVGLMYHHHPFFSRKMRELGLKPSDIQKKEDLGKLPVINKLDWLKDVRDFILQPSEKTIIQTLNLRQKFLGLVNKGELKRRVQYEFLPVTFFSTSGRTNLPAPAFLTNYDLELLQRHSSQVVSKLLEGMEKKVAQNLFPHVPHLAYWQVYLTARGIPDAFVFSLGTERTEFQIKLMEKFGTTIIAGMPTYIKYLSDMAREMKIKSNVRLILFGGEGAPEKMKEKIKDNFSEIGPEPRIISTYGLTETKIALLECEEGSGYHIFPDLHVWEVLDQKTLEPVGEGEGGSLVFSNIDFRGTVFLRYFPGDIAVDGITHEKCPHCGSTVPRIIGKIERTVDKSLLSAGVKVKGELINLNTLDRLISEVEGIKQYQVIIDKKNKKDPYSLDKLVILVGFEKGAREKKNIAGRLIKKVKAFTNITPDVREESPDSIFEKVMVFKGQRVLDRRVKK